MQTKGIITKFEPNKPYTKKDGSQSVVTTIAVKIGDITKFDTYGNQYQKAQIVEVQKFGTMADRFAQLNLQPGQAVELQLDYEQRFGHTEVDIYTISPEAPAQQPAYQQPSPYPQQPQYPPTQEHY